MTSPNNKSIEHQARQYFSENESLLATVEKYQAETLAKICSKYCQEHNLPPQAISVNTRRKSISSFVNKLKRRGILQINDHNENITDTVGARIICWFVDDCYGILETLKQDKRITIIPNSLENFIEHPKETGYRSIHVLTILDSKKLNSDKSDERSSQNVISEIQIRTKLQDSWAEITHEFHYKAKYAGVYNPTYESLLGDISDRLAIEDNTLMKFRDAYGKLTDKKGETY